MSSRYLDQEWKNLRHAYGSAEDVLGLLANLNSPDKATREDAIYELFGNIWHQGTVYPATVKAIPELVALLQSPQCADREMVAVLLASIADGDGYYNVRSQLESLQPAYEKTISDRGSSIAEKIVDENEYLSAIRWMAREFMPLIESYLDSPDPTTREIVASAMVRYAAHFPHYEARLRERLESENEEEVREQIELGLAQIVQERTQE